MAPPPPRMATYTEFKNDVLPRVKKLGYNAVQLMAIAEHAQYGPFGHHVTNFCAPSSGVGRPEELEEPIDAAHGMGIMVLTDIVHAHASSNCLDGILMQDGSDHCCLHAGAAFPALECRWWIDDVQACSGSTALQACCSTPMASINLSAVITITLVLL